MAKDLPSVKGIAITTDIWTSRNNDPFQGFTLHYVDQNWMMQKMMLDCQPFEGSHTGEQIALLLDSAISEIEHLPSGCYVTCITDSGTNMLAAMTESKKEDGKVSYSLTCIDHRLNNAMKKVLDHEDVKPLVQLCKDLASRTHRSALSHQRIQQACQSKNGKIVRLSVLNYFLIIKKFF